MPDHRSLGRLVALHPISPAHMQRAVFAAVLSFIFFTGMMLMLYIRQNLVYFLLASAFLVIYLVMMSSFFMARKKTVEVYENGLRIGRETIFWSDIDSIDDDGSLTRSRTPKTIAIAFSIVRRDELLAHVRGRLQ